MGVQRVAALLGDRQPLAGVFLVGTLEAGKDFAQVGDGFVKQTGECLAIFNDDFRPHGRISRGDAGGIAQAAAAEAALGRIVQALIQEVRQPMVFQKFSTATACSAGAPSSLVSRQAAF